MRRKTAIGKGLAWVLTFSALLTRPVAAQTTAGERPNIVYILADDLGYGDVKCLNAGGKLATPNLDRLAAQGMIFTDAHGSSAVCTPTRYGILTGRYNWRSRLQSGVLNGYSPALIKPGQLTVAALLKEQGYQTACFGKWHLGLDLPPNPTSGDAAANPAPAPVDFTRPITDSPVNHGFDYFFGISGSLDMPPFVYIENNHWTEVPTVEKRWGRQGPAAADFEAVDVLPTLTRKVIAYLDEHARTGGPIFLYFPLNSPHTPIVPAPAWKGKSGINDYGDFVMETDWAVGQVLAAMDRNGLVTNTLVMFASDNGCSPSADYPTLLAHGHNPSYLFRGTKSDIWDGGHHIPLLVRWPGKIAAGTSSDQTVSLNDLMATCADILGTTLPPTNGQDSVSLLPALLGKADKPLREAIVYHSIEGRFAIRQGNWKLELCPGSGGWSNPRDPAAKQQGLPLVQLYDLAADIGETNNLQAAHPEVVARLTQLLEKYVAEGRSTPGPSLANDRPVDIWKNRLNAPKKTKPANAGEPVPD